MQLSVSKSRISGSICVPGSKSHTIRALAFASVAQGTSILKAPLVAEDTISALAAASCWAQPPALPSPGLPVTALKAFG